MLSWHTGTVSVIEWYHVGAILSLSFHLFLSLSYVFPLIPFSSLPLRHTPSSLQSSFTFFLLIFLSLTNPLNLSLFRYNLGIGLPQDSETAAQYALRAAVVSAEAYHRVGGQPIVEADKIDDNTEKEVECSAESCPTLWVGHPIHQFTL